MVKYIATHICHWYTHTQYTCGGNESQQGLHERCALFSRKLMYSLFVVCYCSACLLFLLDIFCSVCIIISKGLSILNICLYISICSPPPGQSVSCFFARFFLFQCCHIKIHFFFLSLFLKRSVLFLTKALAIIHFCLNQIFTCLQPFVLELGWRTCKWHVALPLENKPIFSSKKELCIL